MATPDHDAAFEAYEAKYPGADTDRCMRFAPGFPEWVRVGARISVDDEPATVIRVDDELKIVEYRHGDA